MHFQMADEMLCLKMLSCQDMPRLKAAITAAEKSFQEKAPGLSIDSPTRGAASQRESKG